MSSQVLNVGIVGTGIFATDKHLPNMKATGVLNPFACYNRTKSKADVFAKKADIKDGKVYSSMEEIFQDEDVNFIDALLPVQYNLDAVKLAVKYNKPIAFEKPIAANLTQAKEIVKISEQSKLPIMILENWVFIKAIEILKKEVLPKIGEVVGFTYRSTGAWNDHNKYLSTSWRQHPEHIGGFLSDGGVHQLALLTEVLGEVKSVSGLTKQLREESGTDDVLFSTMKLKSDVIGTFTYGSSFGATDKSTSFIIYGRNGSLIYDFSPSLDKPTITYETGTSSQTASEKTTIKIDEVNNIQEEMKNFAEAVRANDKNLVLVSPAKAFHHLAIVAAALESSKKDGASVEVASPN